MPNEEEIKKLTSKEELLKLWHVGETSATEADRLSLSKGFKKLYAVDAREFYIAWTRQMLKTKSSASHPFRFYSAESHLRIVKRFFEPLQRPLQFSVIDDEASFLFGHLFGEGTNRILPAAGWLEGFKEGEYPYAVSKLSGQETLIPTSHVLDADRSHLGGKIPFNTPIAPTGPSRQIVIAVKDEAQMLAVAESMDLPIGAFKPYEVVIPVKVVPVVPLSDDVKKGFLNSPEARVSDTLVQEAKNVANEIIQFSKPSPAISDLTPLLKDFIYSQEGIDLHEDIQKLLREWQNLLKETYKEVYPFVGLPNNFGTSPIGKYIDDLLSIEKSAKEVEDLYSKFIPLAKQGTELFTKASKLVKDGKISQEFLDVIRPLFEIENNFIPGSFGSIIHSLRNTRSAFGPTLDAIPTIPTITDVQRHVSHNFMTPKQYVLEVLKRPDLVDVKTFKELLYKLLNQPESIRDILNARNLPTEFRPSFEQIDKYDIDSYKEAQEILKDRRKMAFLHTLGYEPGLKEFELLTDAEKYALDAIFEELEANVKNLKSIAPVTNAASTQVTSVFEAPKPLPSVIEERSNLLPSPPKSVVLIAESTEELNKRINSGYYYIVNLDGEKVRQYMAKNGHPLINPSDERSLELIQWFKDGHAINQYPYIEFVQEKSYITPDGKNIVEGKFVVGEGNHRFALSKNVGVPVPTAFRSKEEAEAFLQAIGQVPTEVSYHVPTRVAPIGHVDDLTQLPKLAIPEEVKPVVIDDIAAIEAAKKSASTIRRSINIIGWVFMGVDLLTKGVSDVSQTSQKNVAWRLLRLRDNDLNDYLQTVASFERNNPRVKIPIEDAEIDKLWRDSLESQDKYLGSKAYINAKIQEYERSIKDLNKKVVELSRAQIRAIRDDRRARNLMALEFATPQSGLELIYLTDKDIDALVELEELNGDYDILDGVFRWEMQAAIKRLKWLDNLVDLSHNKNALNLITQIDKEFEKVLLDAKSNQDLTLGAFVGINGDILKKKHLKALQANHIDQYLNINELFSISGDYRKELINILSLKTIGVKSFDINAPLAKLTPSQYPIILDEFITKLNREQLDAFKNKLILGGLNIILALVTGGTGLILSNILLSSITAVMEYLSVQKAPSFNAFYQPEKTTKNSGMTPELTQLAKFWQGEAYIDLITLDEEFKKYFGITRGEGLVDKDGNQWASRELLEKFKHYALTYNNEFLFPDDKAIYDSMSDARSPRDGYGSEKEAFANKTADKWHNAAKFGLTPEIAEELKNRGWLVKTQKDFFEELWKARSQRFNDFRKDVKPLEPSTSWFDDIITFYKTHSKPLPIEISSVKIQDALRMKNTPIHKDVPAIKEDGVEIGMINPNAFTENPALIDYMTAFAVNGDISATKTLLSNGLLPEALAEKFVNAATSLDKKPLNTQTLSTYKKIDKIDVDAEAYKVGLTFESLTPIKKELFLTDVINNAVEPTKAPYITLSPEIYQESLNRAEIERLHAQDNLFRHTNAQPISQGPKLVKGSPEYLQVKEKAEKAYEELSAQKLKEANDEWKRANPQVYNEIVKKAEQRSIDNYLLNNASSIEQFADNAEELYQNIDAIQHYKDSINKILHPPVKQVADKSEKIKNYNGLAPNFVFDNQTLEKNSKWVSSNFDNFKDIDKKLNQAQKDYEKLSDTEKKTSDGQRKLKYINDLIAKKNVFIDNWNNGVDHVNSLLDAAEKAEKEWAKDIGSKSKRDDYNQKIRDAYQAYRVQYLNKEARTLAKENYLKEMRALYKSGPGTSQGDKKNNGHSYGCYCSKCKKVTEDKKAEQKLAKDADEAKRKAAEDAEQKRKARQQQEDDEKKKLADDRGNLPSDDDLDNKLIDMINALDALIDALEEMLAAASASSGITVKSLLEKLRKARARLYGKLKNKSKIKKDMITFAYQYTPPPTGIVGIINVQFIGSGIVEAIAGATNPTVAYPPILPIVKPNPPNGPYININPKQNLIVGHLVVGAMKQIKNNPYGPLVNPHPSSSGFFQPPTFFSNNSDEDEPLRPIEPNIPGKFSSIEDESVYTPVSGINTKKRPSGVQGGGGSGNREPDTFYFNVLTTFTADIDFKNLNLANPHTS